MAREALIVAAAVGTDDGVEQILARYGFAKSSTAASLNDAIELLGQRHFDLVLVPIDALDDAALGRIDRAIRRERFTAVIGTAPEAHPDLMLRAMRAGIQEFLVRPLVPAELTASLERLMRRTETVAANGQVFAVFAAKGGMGVSTVTVNLADAIARAHPQRRVAVADLGVEGGEARLLMNVDPTYDLAYMAEKAERIDTELLNSVVVPAFDGVWLLASSDRPGGDELVDSNVVTTVIQQLRQAFNYTLLDCEHSLNDRTLAALDAADRIVLVTQLSVPALRGTQRTLGICRRLGYPNDKLCVVVNRHQSGEVISPAEASEVLKSEIFFKLPNDYKAASEASTRGMPVATVAPQSRLTWGFGQLAHKLVGGESATNGNGNGAHAAPTTSRLRSLFTRKKG